MNARPLLSLIAATICAAALGANARAAATAPSEFAKPSPAMRVAARKLFAPFRAKLAKSGVPVLLPGAFPPDYARNMTTDGVRAGASGYGVGLALAPDCDGATACSFGGVTGSKAPKAAPHGRRVQTVFGPAYLDEATCGASCSASSLDFDYRGFRYEVQGRLGDADLIAFANTLLPIATLYAGPK